MEEITLGQIGLAVSFVVGLIGGLSFLHKHLKDWLSSSLEGQFSELKYEVQKISDHVNAVDVEACKNYLVRMLADIESGCSISEIEMSRFWEQYQHYEHIGGNSYIHRKVEQLKEDGKL